MHALWQPHSIESEQSLLGAVLINNDAYTLVQEIVEPQHFSEPIHQQLFGVCGALIRAGKLASPLTIGPFLPANIEVGNLTLGQYIIRVAAEATTIVNARDFAQVVRDLYDLRTIGEIGEQLRPRGGIDPVEQAAWGVEQLDSIVSGRALVGVRAMSLQASVARAVDAAAVAYQNEGKLLGLPYGLSDLDAKLLGAQRGHLVVIAARPSMGKAQPLDANILLRDGKWSEMGSISVGDELASVDGQRSVVTAVFPQGRKPIYCLTFSDGRSAEACDDHLWSVSCRHWASPRVLSTQQVSSLIKKQRYKNRLWIETHSGEFGTAPSDAKIDPWVLGVLLGDGCITEEGGPRFSSADLDLVELMRTRLGAEFRLTLGGRFDYRISGVKRRSPNLLSERLQELSLWGKGSSDKFIPPQYLSADRDTRLELLRGLLDTDGWVETGLVSTVRFCSVSKPLAEGVVDIVRSLGGSASISVKQPFFTSGGKRKKGLPAFVVNILGLDGERLFSLERKQSRMRVRTRKKRLNLRSVEYSRTCEAQCIRVSHPSQLYITDNYVVTHNSALALCIARNMAWANYAGVFYSLEMGDIELSQRMIADEIFDDGRMTYWQIRSGRFHESAFQRITEAAERLSRLPLVIEQQPGLSVSQIAARARQRKRRGKLDFMVVDHLGLIASSGRYSGSRVNEIGEMTAGLKGLAKELDCAVFLLAQLNRAVEGREDKRPRLADLRESGSIEQDADAVIMLYRKAYYLERSEPAAGSAEFLVWQKEMEDCHNELHLGIEKNRAGPVGSVKVFCDIGCNAVRNYSNDQYLPMGDMM